MTEDRPLELEAPADSQTWTERIEVAGEELIGLVKRLIEDATVTRLVIRKETGETMVEVPVAVGGAVAGALTLFAPVLAALGAMASLVAKVQVDIVRKVKDESGET